MPKSYELLTKLGFKTTFLNNHRSKYLLRDIFQSVGEIMFRSNLAPEPYPVHSQRHRIRIRNRVRYIRKQDLDSDQDLIHNMVQIPGAEDSRKRFYDAVTVKEGQNAYFFRKQKAGGRDGGECSDADEGFMMTGRK